MAKSQDGELVELSTAAMVVYKNLTGAELSAGHQLLPDVAHALANVAQIFGVRSEGDKPEPVSPIDLVQGVFQRGATVLRTRKGIEYSRLYMQRDDMRAAITILRQARIRFGRNGT